MTHMLPYLTAQSARSIALFATGIAAFFVFTALSSPAPSQAQIATGGVGAHTCALLEGNELKCWGSYSEQLGLTGYGHRGDEPDEMGNNLSPLDLGTDATPVQLAPGVVHICALFEDGTLKCWGGNYYGQLGLGDTEWRGLEPSQMGDNLPTVDLGADRDVVSISSNGHHTCALFDDGAVKCWGLNDSGQLGLGNTESKGDDPNELGDQLPTVDLGTGRTATQVVTGFNHTCALLDNGSVKCWGNNWLSQLGLEDDEFRGDEPGEMGDNLPSVNLGTGRTATQIDAGDDHTCALLDNGDLKCWGTNGRGQLGLGDYHARGDDPNEMGDFLPAVDLGSGRIATQIEAGSEITCTLLDNAELKCWGSNLYGQLGMGDTESRGDEPNEMGNYLPPVELGANRTATQVTAGLYHVCALLDNREVKCWGNNDEGQLGLGDTDNRGDNPGEMGDDLPPVDLGGQVLPVELTNFTATLDGSAALLTWTTASETNNAGFEVQHQADAAPWQVLAFIEGRGTTTEAHTYHHRADGLATGLHRFRLKQIDLDGAYAYSPEVEMTIGIDAAYALTAPAPNPFGDWTALTLTVRQAQHVRAVAYNALGQQVAVFFDSPVPKNTPQILRLGASNQPSGLYLLRITGERFTATRRVVLVR